MTVRENERVQHMNNASAFAERLVDEAELHGIDGKTLFVAFARVLAGRNASLAGKVLASIGAVVAARPIVKIVRPLVIDGKVVEERTAQ